MRYLHSPLRLPQRVFSVFVLEALVLTFMTAPLVYGNPNCQAFQDVAKHTAANDARGLLISLAYL